MTTLIRRDNRDPGRRYVATPGFDPLRIVDAFFGGDVFSPFDAAVAPRAFAPSFEVRETKDAYVFKADVPGLADKDVEIQLTGNVLTISGDRKRESVQEGERYFAVERAYGKFSRSFTLPDGVDAEHVTADLKEGVLTLRVPKKPEVQPRRISVGAPQNAAKA